MSSAGIVFLLGAGGGVGTALARRLSDRGYGIVLFARTLDKISELAKLLPNTHAVQLDVTQSEKLSETLDAMVARFGLPQQVIFNAVSGSFGSFEDQPLEVLEQAMETNLYALYRISQSLVPQMMERGSGALLATGNTSAYRGSKDFAAFAPSKAAQRIFLESVARKAWPSGVHVSYVAIDAVIDQPFMRDRFPDKSDDFFCKPDDIAYTCDFVLHQPKSAWNFDVTIRPFGENW